MQVAPSDAFVLQHRTQDAQVAAVVQVHASASHAQGVVQSCAEAISASIIPW